MESTIEKEKTTTDAQYIQRPRVDEILQKATQNKLVYVIAGAGYGKTQAVRHYIEQQPDAIIRWMQLTESDNISSRYWENLVHFIEFDNPELAEKLREFGFPETTARFKQFATILRDTEHRSLKTYLILDDFHLIHSEQALQFAQRCAHLQIPGSCVIIISRTEPPINAVSLLAKGQVHIITEDELRFTETEIADFFTQREVQYSIKSIPQISDATKGWALAVHLFSLVLKRLPGSFETALETMKSNVYKLMETEAFDDFPENIKKLLVKLSLVSNLPLAVLQKLYHESTLLQDAPQLTAFIWFDSFTGADRVHPMYWEFLQSKHDILTIDEKRDTYRQAAKWCIDNNLNLDAMQYLSNSQDYDKMLELMFTYPFKLPHDTCEYFKSIIDSIEVDDDSNENASLVLLKNFFIPLLIAGMGEYQAAEEKALAVVDEWEKKDSQIASNLLYASYSSLVYIDMYNCTFTHKYESPKYIKKTMEYYAKASVPFTDASSPFFVADIRSLACPIGLGADLAEFDEYLGAMMDTADFIAKTHHGMYYGYDDLVKCELAFYKNQPDAAKSHAHQAISRARERKQYSIEMMATQYLLRIATHEGDFSMVSEVLRQLRTHLENQDFWNRQLLYDLFTGLFYAQIGVQNLVATWLIMDVRDLTSEVRIPTRELVVGVKYHIAAKKYDQALMILNNSYPREPQEQFLLSELVLSLLSAIARNKTGDVEGSLEEFERAYEMSFDGVFEMPFIELGKNLQPLVNAAMGSDSSKIPNDWLKSIDRKASIYAKKAATIANAFKRTQKIDDSVSLSGRETEVLGDLYHGLSREEIAENRYLSVNTVKKILQSIYLKLDANNNVDAIRIALEKGILEQ